jgi:hypothetical protein
MHLADMAAAMENGTQGTRRGINNRPGTNRPGSLVLPAPQPEPVFDQTNQQNMLEHMDTPSEGATGTIPGFPEVPADLNTFTFDASSFPDYPGFLNNGPPTSPAAATFIDDYLNAPTSPQGLLDFEGQQVSTVVPEPPAPAVAPTTLLEEVVSAPIAGASGMTAGTTPKPRSPRRSRSPPTNPNRLIAPNTPAEGIARPMGDSTARSQTPDVNNIVAASPEDEDINKLPTKGPLRVRKDTIAAKKRANQIRARTRSPTGETVQHARRSARPNIPPQGAMAISPETSIPSQQQMATDEEEADTESDAAIRRRRRSNSANQASSSSEQNSDQRPSQPKRPGARSAVVRAAAQKAYQKAYDDAPDKTKLVSRRDMPQGVGSLAGFQKYIKKRNEEQGVQSEGIRSIKMKAARNEALTNLYDNEPDGNRLSVKELVDKYNKNPSKAYTPLTPSMLRTFNTEYRKRKQTEPVTKWMAK